MIRTHLIHWSLLIALALADAAGCADRDPLAEDPATVDPSALARLDGGVVIDWNDHTIDAIVTGDGYADPMAASRVLALVHLAMHDAINATAYRLYEPYAFARRDVRAHPTAAAAAAAQRVLVGLYPAQRPALSSKLADSIARVPRGAGSKRGVALGERVADALLASRRNDRSSEAVPYEPGSEPGDYQYTTPDVIAAPGWRNVTPWALRTADQFRPSGPPPLDSAEYAAAYNEVRALGGAQSAVRTADQAASARFWYEFSERGWNRVTRVVAQQEGLGLAATARLFALVNIAMADSYVAGWDAKFHYDFWRPVTAIAAADRDGNADTAPELGWASFLPTPPVQDHPSTHSALGAAAAEVLAHFFGDRGDAIGFSMTSTTAARPNVDVHSFASFRAAAAENAESRVIAGVHFRFACEAGLELGRYIGKHVFDNFLRSRRSAPEQRSQAVERNGQLGLGHCRETKPSPASESKACS
jgi:hypothetical protein